MIDEMGTSLFDAGIFIGALLIGPPSAIQVLEEGPDTILRALELASLHNLTARRVHDARHAAAALGSGVRKVYTYDADDWLIFAEDGLQIAGPGSTLVRLSHPDPL